MDVVFGAGESIALSLSLSPLHSGHWGLPWPPAPPLRGALPPVLMPELVHVRPGVMVLGSWRRWVMMSVCWLCAGVGSSWEVGWAEMQGLSPEELLRAAGTAQHPFVVAPRSWHGAGAGYPASVADVRGCFQPSVC